MLEKPPTVSTHSKSQITPEEDFFDRERAARGGWEGQNNREVRK